MMARVGQICRIEDAGGCGGGTFHHVAHGLLREHAPRLDTRTDSGCSTARTRRR